MSVHPSIQEWPDPWPSSTKRRLGSGEGSMHHQGLLCSLLTSLRLKNSKDVPCCWAVSSTPWIREGSLLSGGCCCEGPPGPYGSCAHRVVNMARQPSDSRGSRACMPGCVWHVRVCLTLLPQARSSQPAHPPLAFPRTLLLVVQGYVVWLFLPSFSFLSPRPSKKY